MVSVVSENQLNDTTCGCKARILAAGQCYGAPIDWFVVNSNLQRSDIVPGTTLLEAPSVSITKVCRHCVLYARE